MASNKSVVDWDKMDNMLANMQDSNTPGQPINNQNPDEVPVVFLDTSKLKGSEETITAKIVLTKSTPMWKVGFHYSLTPYLADNQKFICVHETTDLSSNGDTCIPCDFMQSKRFQKLRSLAWNFNKNQNNILADFDPATQEFLQNEAKDILNLRPVVFYYITFVKVPYDGSIHIYRCFEQEAMKILSVIMHNKEKGNVLFDWKKGYNLVLNLERKSNSRYMNIKSVEISDDKAPLTKDKDAVKKLEEFLKTFDVFARMKIGKVDLEAQKELTKKWLQLKEAGLKRCGYAWNKDEEKYIYTPVEKKEEPVIETEQKEESTDDFNVDQILSELDDLDIS